MNSEDKKMPEIIHKILSKIAFSERGISYEELRSHFGDTIPESVLRDHLEEQRVCDFIEEYEVGEKKIYRATESGKHMLSISYIPDDIPYLQTIIDKVIIDEGVEDEILWRVLENREKEFVGDLYGFKHDSLEEKEGRYITHLVIEVLGSVPLGEIPSYPPIIDEFRQKDYKLVGWYRSHPERGIFLNEVDKLEHTNYEVVDSHAVLMAINPKHEGSDDPYRFVTIDFSDEEKPIIRVPHEIKLH